MPGINDQDKVILEIKDLSVITRQIDKRVQLLDKISFKINEGETTALIGESGSGKTITAYALLNLLPENLEINNGTIKFDGKRLSTSAKDSYDRKDRKTISMIFQEPMTALNPVFKIGEQLAAVLKISHKYNSVTLKENIFYSLSEVGFTTPETIYNSYPHQLSGGMAQRVMIAMALSCRPRLVIADEPTTALDVTTQINILNLIHELQQTHKFSLLMISHDMGIISSLCESVIIMRKGQVIYKGKFQESLSKYPDPYIRSFFDHLEPG